MKPEVVEEVARLANERRVLIERLRTRPEGLDWCEEHSDLIDLAIRKIYESVVKDFPEASAIALAATGGYGRRELAPYSDIDLTVVPLDDGGVQTDALVKELFRDLQTAFGSHFGLHVGYAYRLVNDAPGLDEKTRTSLLDARLLAGSHLAMDALFRLFWETFPTGEFLIAKMEERQEAWAKHNDTPLVVEPHLKEGAGGLRSFQCANWFRYAIGERPVRPAPAYQHILAMRNLTHLVAGKPQDVLTRQRQAEIADLLEEDVYSMMASTAQAALELHREYERAIDRLHESRFELGGGVMALRGEARILGDTTMSAAALGVANATRLGLRVEEIPTRTNTAIDGPEALQAISTGEPTLRNLDRCGLLSRLLPELEECKTLMPQDSAHTFTVFEHTMRVVRNLDSLTPGAFLGDLKAELADPEPLYLAALLHDIGKADPSAPHSITGEAMVREIADRWNLGESVREDVAVLVREHLTMAKFIRMRDLSNPQTVNDFAEIVADEEILAMLTLLTWADINAVSSSAWSPVQESFLKELYERTVLTLRGSGSTESDTAVFRKRLLKELMKEEIPEAEVQRFLDSLPAHYIVATPPELVRLHVHYEKIAREGNPTVELFHQPELGTTEVTVCCLDQHGLLSRLLGVVYAFDLSVHLIRAGTTKTDPAVALDVFSLSFGGRTIPAATGKQLISAIKAVITGEKDAEDLLRQKGKDPSRLQQNFSFTFVEGNPGILEVRAPRGRGMAYRFSRLISQQHWNIQSARVGQWAGRGAAAFYITAEDDKALTSAEVNTALKA